MAGLTMYRLFRSPIGSVTTGPTTNFPLGVDKDTIIKWYYRVKVWDVTVTFTATGTTSSTPKTVTSTLSSPQSIDSQLPSLFIDEKQFLLRQPSSTTDGIHLFQQNQDFATFPLVSSAAQLDFNIDFLFSLGYVGGLYYPGISWSGQVQSNAGWTGNGGSGSVSEEIDSSPTFYPDPYDINWEIDGLSCVTTSSKLTTSVLGEGGTASCSSELSLIQLTPKEYWPYNPDDGGGPIYQSSDGTMLRDPFSVQ